MKAVNKIEISVLHKRITPIVYAVQGDTGREIECTVVDWDIPAGVTARVWVVKPSKKVVYNDCRIVDKAVFVPMTNQTLAEPGGAICMIEFVSGEDVVSSFSFNLYVYESASGDGIPSENESTVLEGMFEELAQDAINTLNEAKAQAAAAEKSAQDTEKIKNDFTLTAQQAVADVNNAGQTQTQRVNTAGDTQVSRVQAEGTTQVQNVQATAAEISADREQIHTNRENTARLQRTAAGAIIREAEGSFITLEDAADEMGFRQIEIPGMTEQRTTTGAQLLNLSDVENAISNGLTYSIKNGVVTASGTPTVEYASIVAKKIKLPPGNYYASGIDTTSGRLFLQMAITSANGNKTFYSNKGFTIDGTEQSIDFVIQIGSNITALSKCTLYPMLNAGTTALPWEPYTGNKPSPSPECPKEMKNVGVLNEDGKYEVKIRECGKNIAEFKALTATTQYIGVLYGEAHLTPNTSYCISGSATAKNSYYLNEKLFTHVAFTVDSNGHFAVIATTVSDVSINNASQYTPGYGWLLIKNNKENAAHNFSELQMEIGNVATEYFPHRGHTATITSDRPLTKWDKLTCRDGVWGWAYGAMTIVLDGTELWTKWVYTTSEGYFVAFTPAKNINANVHTILSSHFMYDASVGAKEGIYGNNKMLHLTTRISIASSVDELKTWLANHHVTVVYKLAEEEWVPLSVEEQAAMNALCTYAGTTHIWTDDPLHPVISLDYTLDTEGYIRNVVVKNLQLDIAEQITDLQAQIDQLTINNNL